MDLKILSPIKSKGSICGCLLFQVPRVIKKALGSRDKKEYHLWIRCPAVSLEDRKQMEGIWVKHLYRTAVVLGDTVSGELHLE